MNDLGPLLFNVSDGNLSDVQKIEVTRILTEIFGNKIEECKKLLKILKINQFEYQNTFIPLNSKHGLTE